VSWDDGGRRGPSGPRAGFWIRFAAALIDGLALSLLNTLLVRLFGGVGEVLEVGSGAVYLIAFFGSRNGQTLGYMITGLRVVSITDGGPIGPARAAIRWAVGVVSAFALLLGYFWMLWDPERQTWFDKASRSVVVPTGGTPFGRAA
jgi:uncharacterized RDD family membrane protein YckC